MADLSSLFQPGAIGKMPLRNRIIMAPMGTLFAEVGGAVTDRLCRYYAERAKGGAGLIIVEITAVSPEGRGHARSLGVWDDRFIPGLRQLTDAVHRHGAKVALQIAHTGRQTSAEAAGGQPVAPSPIPCPLMRVMPRELTTADIARLVEAFGQGARRARDAGFDAVEVHGAHGYLVCQFLSAWSNQRQDEYGGSLDNRLRFPLEVVASIREQAGTDFPLLFRMSAKEFVAGGLDIDEARVIAPRLEKAGVHCIDVSAGNYGAFHMTSPPSWVPRAYLAPLAAEVKKVVSIPVSVAARINDPTVADRIIAEGKTDFVSLGRPLLADPDLPNKAREGRLDDIRMCIACNYCIDTVVGTAQPLTCAVNAAAGREDDFAIAPAPEKKRVVVVGGGPGGMEAARVAALRGHRVTLFEQAERLGGQLPLAAAPPGKDEFNTLVRFLTAQLGRLGVEVRTGRPVAARDITTLHPDAVIIATGSSTTLPDIPGARLPHVALARDVIAGTRVVGQKVVVVGGGRVGCETAELLAGQGKEVTLVRMSGRGRLAGDTGRLTRRPFLEHLRSFPVTVEADSPVERITDEGVVIRKDGQPVVLKADTVVLSPAPSPSNQLAAELKAMVPELYIVGDAVQPRGVAEAIHEGFRAGFEI